MTHPPRIASEVSTRGRIIRPLARVALLAFLFLASTKLLDYLWRGRPVSDISFNMVSWAITLAAGLVTFCVAARKPFGSGTAVLTLVMYWFSGLVVACLILSQSLLPLFRWTWVSWSIFLDVAMAMGAGITIGWLVSAKKRVDQNLKLEKAKWKGDIEQSEFDGHE
jgi:hypothetical protein